MKKPNRILWVDMETTGLDPECCVPIEIAIVLTGPDLETVIGSNDELVEWEGLLEPPPAHGHVWEPGAYKMHAKSGLLMEWEMASARLVRAGSERPEEPSRATVPDVQDWICTVLLENEGIDAVLGGSSVHFDRRFLESYFPKVAMLLSHRNYDTSTLHLEALAASDTLPTLPESTPHRAMADLRRSISTARMLRERANGRRSYGGYLR